MTILTLNKKELEEKIGKIDDKIRSKIDMFGTPVDDESDSEISIEVFPNRPDLLSLEGFCRGFLGFLGKGKIKEYRVEKPDRDFKVVIDKSVKKVRPFTSCAIVKGIKFDEKRILEVIELQEKLHGSFGRNRKKVAIGIYPLEEIKLPIKYYAKKPEEIKFRPLEFPREINGRQILSQHPKGRDYAELLAGCDVFPIFEDAEGSILSMPPIINSEKTGKISNSTKDVFVECSGFDKEYLDKAINIISCALSDMGGKIYGMEVEDGNDKYLSPNLESEKMEIEVEYVNRNLGLSLDDVEVKGLLGKMGIGCEKGKGKEGKGKGNLVALIPAYRNDILHEIDLVEEVAIAYGYDNFELEIPEISTIGEESRISIMKNKIREILVGLGLLEISTFHLSTKEKQFKRIGVKEFKDRMIEVLDSKTENNVLRDSLFAQTIMVLSENSDASYPQRIFEIGKVFRLDDGSDVGVREVEKLCVTLCSESVGFTEVRQILDYLMRMLSVSYEVREGSREGFIEGRVGEVFVGGKSIGFLGEVKPSVLKNGRIGMPVASVEIGVDELIYPK
jgi:phenylalanyl-tRNA synthetase beta chain